MEEKKKDNFLGMSIVLAALIIGGALVYSSGAKGNPTQAANLGNTVAGTNTGSISNISVDDDVILGDPEAPVTLVFFGDFQCPYCKKLFDETEIKLRDAYVKTGKVRMVYRDFPLDSIHPFARPTAIVAECARDQGKYWMYHDELFTRQSEIPTMDFIALASSLGMNTQQFRSCVESQKYANEVQGDYEDGVAAGVRGTPATFVNGRLVSGAVPYEEFERVIEEELAKTNK
ncbi:MAG: DsbA family protein [Patescibacteria group bacterium]